jgi:hypothetical protein
MFPIFILAVAMRSHPHPHRFTKSIFGRRSRNMSLYAIAYLYPIRQRCVFQRNAFILIKRSKTLTVTSRCCNTLILMKLLFLRYIDC